MPERRIGARSATRATRDSSRSWASPSSTGSIRSRASACSNVGCGDGALTAAIVARGAEVVGIDSSPSLVEAARTRGIDARVIDAYAMPFRAEFDAAFSNAALHWMREPDLVLAGIQRALVSRGRFVGELGAHGNVAAISTAILAVLRAHGIDGEARWPWYFPTPAEYAEKLETHGFVVLRMELIPRPTPLPTGMRGWLDTFANPFLAGVSDGERHEMLEEVTSLLAPSLRGRAGEWTADYVRLRFSAQLER